MSKPINKKGQVFTFGSVGFAFCFVLCKGEIGRPGRSLGGAAQGGTDTKAKRR